MRDNGFYWVKLDGAWRIASIEGKNEVYFFGSDHFVSKKDLDEIGDKIEVPEKYR